MLLDRPMAGRLLGSTRYQQLLPSLEETSGRLWYVSVYDSVQTGYVVMMMM